MSVTMLLLFSCLLQCAIRFIFQLIVPTLFEVNGFLFFYLAFSTLLSIALPTYLYLKNEEKPYFCNVAEGVKPDSVMLLAAGMGVICQFSGIALNLPVISAITKWVGPISSSIPEINTLPSLLIGILVMAVIPGICEEILFRGVIFNSFRDYGQKCAVTVSAVMFAIMHLDFTNFVGPMVMGIVFGIMMANTNRLIYPIFAHIVVNASAVLLSYGFQFEIFVDFYNDFLPVLLIGSLVALIPLTRCFVQHCQKHELQYYHEYEDQVTEIQQGEHSIRIIEHDVKENNFRLIWKELLKKPSFYILIILFLVLGGSIFYA